jgi:hypothetical protein
MFGCRFACVIDNPEFLTVFLCDLSDSVIFIFSLSQPYFLFFLTL